MFERFPIAAAATLFSDPARVAILISLLHGESRPAGEIARMAGISAQSASGHLAKLKESELIGLVREGRHHYYRIERQEVVIALEALAVLHPRPKTSSIQEKPDKIALRFARTCYDHLAGELAVNIAAVMKIEKLLSLDRDYPELTAAGETFIHELGINLDEVRSKRQPCMRYCLDWTERRHHLGGPFGSAMLHCFQQKGWLVRVRGSRAVRLTEFGQREFKRRFSLEQSASRHAYDG